MPDYSYTIQRSKRRSIALRIEPDATFVVKAPLRMSDSQIQRFVHDNCVWIDEHIAKAQKNVQAKKDTGGYLYLGTSLKLSLGNYTRIIVKDNALLFPAGLAFRLDKELHEWYVKEARTLITRQVQMYAEEMGTHYKELTFSDTKSQWGRCTHDNRLQFSWRLIMAPIFVLNYVVIHELAHTYEKNHTRAFWAIVRRYNPSYRTQIKWLKDHGQSLKT